MLTADELPLAPGVLDASLELLQRASLGRRPRGTAPTNTHTHIPGSVLRGALAAAWIRDHGTPQRAPDAQRAAFEALFEGGVRYGPLFDPASDVVPLSVQRCKYQPEDACRRVYRDEADPATVNDTGGDARCEACEGPLVPGRGEVTHFGSAAVVADITRTALTDEGTAAGGLLFTRRVLEHRVGDAPRRLTGRLVLPPGLPAAAREWLPGGHTVRVGGDRSVAGGATLTLQPPARAPGFDPAACVRDGVLVLRLTSPALLLDAAGRPDTRPDADTLSELLGVRARVDTGRGQWVRRERISGWNGHLNLPKPEELAVAAGSVYRIVLDAAPTAAGLGRLYRHGLGVRRAEGFGWVELGPWPLPPFIETVTRPRGETMATGMARAMYESDVGGWLLPRLRRYAQDKRAGRPADRGFLTARALEEAMLDGRFRGRLTALLNCEADLIEETLTHLEAHLRGVKR